MDSNERVGGNQTVSRLRRLVADGWTPTGLREQLGWAAGRVEQLVANPKLAGSEDVRVGRWVTTAEQAAVRELYLRLRYDDVLVDQVLTGAPVEWHKLDVGERVRVVGYLRTRRRMSAAETALKLGVCARTVQRWTAEYRADLFADAA